MCQSRPVWMHLNRFGWQSMPMLIVNALPRTMDYVTSAFAQRPCFDVTTLAQHILGHSDTLQWFENQVSEVSQAVAENDLHRPFPFVVFPRARAKPSR